MSLSTLRVSTVVVESLAGLLSGSAVVLPKFIRILNIIVIVDDGWDSHIWIGLILKTELANSN